MTGKGSARRPTNAEAYGSQFDVIFRKKTMSEWQKIETAPKDGTEVIVMYMHIDTQTVHNAFYASEADGWDADDVGWWSYEHSEVSRIKLADWMAPTHWMPLPPPPKDQL